jgi:hypothetical protein
VVVAVDNANPGSSYDWAFVRNTSDSGDQMPDSPAQRCRSFCKPSSPPAESWSGSERRATSEDCYSRRANRCGKGAYTPDIYRCTAALRSSDLTTTSGIDESKLSAAPPFHARVCRIAE